MSNKVKFSSIKKLVAALPEIYQPVFGHPKYSSTVSRECHDRLEYISKVYKALEAQVQRPLRVLDLGCAQGFFSLSLAKLGATVHGVDYLDANIAVCTALAKENPELNVSFQISRIESILEQLQGDQYDLVLGLSVFHHIVHEAGIEAVQQMLAGLADKIAVGIFELALASEPLYWAATQPQEPWQLLSGFAFVHELAQHETHLSDILRPLYFASSHYWCLNDQCGSFDSWQTDSHVLAQGVHQNTRRYYFGNGLVVKLYRIDHAALDSSNLQEHRNEVDFLQASPPGFNSAQLVLQGQHEREVWLVRTQLPGELLIDIMRAGNNYDAKLVLGDILGQLATLEAAGLYHNDVRAWNVLIDSDGHALLIDYGAIVKDSKDCVWPHDIFLGFLIFVHEVTSGVVESPMPLRTVAISPYRLTHPYRKWALSFWSRPPAQWSFKLLHELFMEIKPIEESCTLHTDDPLQRWMQAIEEAVDVQVAAARSLQLQQQQVERNNQETIDKFVQTKTLLEREQELSDQALRKTEAFLEREQELSDQALRKTEALLEREREIVVMRVQMNQLQDHAQWLQNEWDAAKQRLEELSKSTGQLETKLNSANEHNTQLQGHTQWLQNELDAANSKISELNQSSHHWWTVADQLNQEQQKIYASKFWCITWSLRKMMQITKWSLILPVHIIKWVMRLPKHMIKPLMIWAMRKILNNPGIRSRALNMLSKYPRLKQHLRLFAMRSGLIAGSMISTSSHSFGTDSGSQSAVETVYSLNMQEEPLNHLSPRAARIYNNLKKTIEVSRKN